MKDSVRRILLMVLKAGRYQQIQCHLGVAGTDKRCVNGVLCDISPWPLVPLKGNPNLLSSEGSSGRPSERVRDWAGMSINEVKQLIDLNDRPTTPDDFKAVIKYLETGVVDLPPRP